MTKTVFRRDMLRRSLQLGAAASTMAIAADRALAQALVQSDITPVKGQNMSADAPVSIQYVTLVVNDLTKVGDFYQSLLGLAPIARDATELTLGADGTPLLVLREDTSAEHKPREAGLFHTAFLMPDRSALAHWFRHAIAIGAPFTGAADHLVSEALYLDDPEGNGIEIYADRPRDVWAKRPNGQLHMNTQRLDIESLLALDDTPATQSPEGLIVGHVHLQVGEIDALHSFMTQKLGQDLMAHEESAAFYSSGGYHHHFAGNIWKSQGAGPRSANATGLQSVTLRTDGTILDAGTVVDPWGNTFIVEADAERASLA